MSEMKQCPNCKAMLKETAKYCGDCGFRFPNIMDITPETVKQQPVSAVSGEKKDRNSSGRRRHRAGRKETEAAAGYRPRIGLFVVLTIFSVAVIGGFVYLLDVFYQTALAAQEAEAAEEAERGRRDAEEEESVQTEHKDAPLLGTSLKTENGEYYFAKEGDVYFFISDQTENYIRGNIEVRELTKEDIEASEAAGIETAVNDPDFYRVDAVVSQELYYGSKRSGNTYTMYVATNGENAAIYDSGWADFYPAQVGSLAPRGELEQHFDKDPAGAVAVVTTDSGMVAGNGFSVEDIRFGAPEALDDSGYIIGVSSGAESYYLFKNGDFFQPILYASEAPGDVNSATEFLTVQEGSFIGTFAADGGYLYYTTGHETTENYLIDALYRIPLGGGSSELIVKGEVEDFCIGKDAIYYTDYAQIVRIDKDTFQSGTIWDYGVYCFELYGEDILVYDGEAWEIIDAVTGEEYGYVIERINYAYESDVVQIESNMIFHVAYDYAKGEVALHAVDIANGREYAIGGSFTGTASDTYNVFFEGKYVYFSINDWEGIARVDVTNGETEEISLSDYGYYYANEFVRIGGDMVLHAYDDQRNECLLLLDGNMSLSLYR